MNRYSFRPLGAIVSAILCISCTHELREVNSAYDKNIIGGDIKSVEFIIPSFVDEGQDIQTKTVLTSQGFVWAEKDTVGIFPSKGNQIYYEMSSGAGSSSAVFDGGGWALKDEYIYSSYYPLKGDFYLDRKSIPVTYSTEVSQCGNNNSEHLGANAFMFAPETTVSNGKVTFKYWQLGSVLKPRVTLPAGTYTKLVLSTEAPIFVVSGKYDLTTGVDASSSSATMPDFVPVIVPDEDKSGIQSLSNRLTINLEDVEFAAETELIAYIMAAPVDVSNIPITVTIYSGDSPKYRYEYVRTSSFVAQTNHNIRPNEKGLMTTANTTESANTAFAAGETSLSLVDVEDNSVFDLVLPATEEPVNIFMEANEGKCTMNVSYPDGATSPEELNIIASNGSEIVLKTPTSTVMLDGDREYTSVRASTAPNTLIVNENITIGTLYLEKGNVKVYGEIMALNTDDLEEGEHPTLFVYGDIQGQIDDDDVIVRRPIVSVSLDQSALELKPGDVVQLSVITEPQNAIFENVRWSSSDGKVATVAEDGTVTAVSAGECLITVDIDGKQASCTVTVSSPGPEYVDLGLPSGTLWATTNIGATQEEEYGDYFAWGETSPKEIYSSTTYKYCKDGNNRHYTKYVRDISWGEVDGKSFLDHEDDAAYVNWGSNWITPSPTQVKELINTDNTIQTWTNKNGIYGVEFTSKSNGNKLFLPAAGERGLSKEGHCRYWTSNCNMCAMYAYLLDAYENNISCNTRGEAAGTYRTDGLSVRPVWNSPEISELVLEENNIEVPSGETKKINVSFYPENALRFIYWHVPDDNNDYLSVDENGVITGKMIGTSKVYISGGSAQVVQNIRITAPKEPTTYYAGGWYLIAKKGDVISFHADIGSSEDGYNYEYIYLGSKKIFEYSKNNCGNNHWKHDFSYTFTEDFMGWMYFDVGWDCCISNISSTANVIGHGNFYSYGEDDNRDTNYDIWVNTPSYLFSYDHHVLTMY